MKNHWTDAELDPNDRDHVVGITVKVTDELTVEIGVTRSAGSDSAILVGIDTTFEPDARDSSPGLRVNVNDGTVFGVPYAYEEPT